MRFPKKKKILSLVYVMTDRYKYNVIYYVPQMRGHTLELFLGVQLIHTPLFCPLVTLEVYG